MSYHTAIFDMDGTLLNTLKDLRLSVNRALEKNAYPIRSDQQIKDAIGNGAYMLIRRSIPQDIPNPDGVAEKVLEDYQPIYNKHMNDHTEPYPGIVDMLKDLRADGFKIAVLTNKPDSFAVVLSEKFFPGLIDYTLGDRPDIARKPNPEGINIILEKLAAAPAETIYVGDSEVDIRTAKNAGLTSVGVSWGYRPKEMLTAEGADYIIDDPQELPVICKR